MKKRNFTEEQVEFIRMGILDLPTRKLAEAYTKYFGEPLSQTELRRAMERNGIENPRKENLKLPVGTERYSKYYDCIIVKVKDVSVKGLPQKEYGKARNGMWQLKQNLVWEKSNDKKLPKGYVVIFLDGDRTNYEPSNLYATALNVAGTVKRMNMTSEDAEVYKTALMWGDLYYALKG